MIDNVTFDNARIYALVRCSSDKQDFNSQWNGIQNYTKQNNIELPKENIIEEHGISAFKTKYEDRKGLNIILDLVAKDKIDLLIVFNSDRISRRKHDVEDFIFKLTYANVKIISVTEGQLNLNNDTDSLITSIKGWVNEYESKKTAVRVRNGLLAKQKTRCNYAHGKILLGYKVVDKKLVIDETKAPIIRRVYELYISSGTSACINYLEKQGIHKTTQTIMQLLKNSLYKGIQQHNPKYYSEADYNEITYYNKELAIVSESTWNTANDMIKKRRRAKNKSVGYDFRTSFMYEGLCCCSKCGHKLQIQYDYRYNPPRLFLQCRKCKDNKSKEQKNYALSKLEPQIEKGISDILDYELDPNKLIAHYNNLKNNNQYELNELYRIKKKNLNSKEIGIANANKKLEILLTSDLSVDSIKIITDTITRLTKEAEVLKNDITELEQQIQEQKQINQEQIEKIELFTKLGKIYKLASAEKQKQILNILINKIVVSNDYTYDIKVYLNY